MQRRLWLPVLFLALGLAAIGGFAGAAWALTGDGGGQRGASAVEKAVPREAPEHEGGTGPDLFGPGAGPRKGDERAFLGVVLAESPDREGVLVQRVAPRSPAERAGIEADDVIVAVDGEPVDKPGEVVRIVRDAEPGDELTFTVRRHGDERDLEVTLGERPLDLDELMPQMPWEAPGPPEAMPPHEPRPLMPDLRPFRVPPLDRLFEGRERFLERFVSAEIAFRNDEGDVETVRAVAGTVKRVQGGELVLAPKAGGPDERFRVSDETRVWRFLERGELGDIEEGDDVVVVAMDGDEAAAVVILEGAVLEEPS